MSWSMPALYFLTSRSPSPPPLLPASQAALPAVLSPSSSASSAAPSVPSLPSSAIPAVAVILSPVPVSAVSRIARVLSPPPPAADSDRPPVSGKKAKRKASSSSSMQPERLLDDAGTTCIHLSASPQRPLRPQPPVSPPAVAIVLSRWSSLPPFLPALLVPFLCGSALAAAYRLGRAWHADFTPLHIRQQTAGDAGKARAQLLCLDQESTPASQLSSSPPLTASTSCCSSPSSSSCSSSLTTVSCLTPAEAEFGFSSFSSSPTAFLRSVFAANLSHKLHTLKLSTVRLTRESCSLLSSLLFLAHLELRLFESLSDDWRTDFLLSSPTPSSASSHAGLDSVFLHGGVFCDADAALSSSSSISWSPACGRGELAGVAACAAGLLGCLRRLRHLQTLSVLQFVDEQDSDDHPVCSAQSEAVLLAMEGHPHLTQLQLRQARFAPPVFDSAMTVERLRAIPHLQSVHIVDTAVIFPRQCNALMACAALTDVSVYASSSRPGVYRGSRDVFADSAASQLFCSANLPAIATAWRSLRVLIAEDVRVDSRAVGRPPRSAVQNVEEAAQLLTHCQLQHQSPSSAEKQRVAVAGCQSSCAEAVDVTAFIAALSSFQELTTLHLSFLPPHRADSSEAAHCSFSVDAVVWSRVWQPSSSLPRRLQHLTLPVLHGAELPLLLSSCRQLTSLTLLPPVPVPSSFLMSLFYLSGCPLLLQSLSLPLEAGQLGLLHCLLQRLKRWREAGGSDRDAAFALPALHRVSGWSHWRDELLVDWTASSAAGTVAVSPHA